MVSAAVLGLGLFLAQAEPAPVTPPPPPAPLYALGVFGRLGYRVGDEASRLGPAAGFSLGLTFARRYAVLGQTPAIETAVGVDLFHDQFSTGVTGSAPVNPGIEQPFQGQRLLTQTSFAATHTIAAVLSQVRVWTTVGAGMSIGHFSSPEADLRPGDSNAVQPLLRAALGVDVPIQKGMGIAIRGDYTHMLTRPTFTTASGQTLSLFGDLMDLGVGLFYRF